MPLQATNLAELLERSCRASAPRSVFGIKLDGSWWWVAYGELLTLVEAMRGGLAQLGVGRGDAVAIVAPNRLEWAVACYAVCGLGAVLVPLDDTRPPGEHAAVLADCRASVAIAAGGATAAALRRLAGDVTTLAHVVELDWPSDAPGSYRELLDNGRRHPIAAADVRPDDTAALMYDGASATRVCHADGLRQANATARRIDAGRDDRILTLPSWARTFGRDCVLHGLLATGGAIVLGDGDASVVEDAVDTESTIVIAGAAALDRLAAPMDAGMAAQPAALRPMLRRGMVAAARARGGERLGALDRAAAGMFERFVVVPPTPLRRAFVAGPKADARTVQALAARGIAVSDLTTA